MTLWEAFGWSVLRAASVGCVVAWCVSCVVRRGSASDARTPVALKRSADAALRMMVITPVMLPGLLVGYAYRPEGLKWVIEPWKADLLHGLIAIGRTLPWALLVAVLIGTQRTARARVAWEQTRTTRTATLHWFGRCRFWCAAHRGAIVGGLAAALLTFGETEIAALLQARGWPEWTFQKLRGGWPVREIADHLWPVLVLATCAMAGGWWQLQDARRDASEARGGAGPYIWFVLLPVFVVCVLVPLGRLVEDASDGLTALSRQTAFWGELGRTVLAAIIASIAAWTAANWLVDGFGRSRKSQQTVPIDRLRRRTSLAALVLLLAFGVSGPLVVSVVMQLLPGRLLWETVAPQYVALAITLLPMAAIVSAVVLRVGTSRAAVCASQLAEHSDRDVRRTALRQIWWRRIGPKFGALGLLYWLAFWDLQTAALLAPPGWATAPGRLYNLAHYGQSDALAAMLLVLSVIALAFPALALLLSYRWTVR